MPSLIGQSLGRYHILEQLGEGGTAIVYKAFDTQLERNVALKVIRTEKLAGETGGRMLKRFEREARALARLDHPNIVRVIDYGDHDGQPFLVMDYIPSGTLKQKLGRPMPWQEAARLLAPIAAALAFAHERNVIHRDVKPSNILLTDSGTPMLSDFGVAKMLDTEETGDLTGSGIGVGTPEYMAPEQFHGKTDERADVYALGVVFYEMLTRRRPYMADPPAAVIIKQATDPLPRPRQFAADLPEGVEQVLLKALAKDPAHRYPSMAEFAAALEKVAAGEIAALPAWRRLPRPARLWIPLGAALLVVILAAVLALPRIFPAQTGPLPTTAVTRIASRTPRPTSTPRPANTVGPTATPSVLMLGKLLSECANGQQGDICITENGVSRNLGLEGFINLRSPSWSPDGSRIAFASCLVEEAGLFPEDIWACLHLYTIAADGSDLQEVLFDGRAIQYAAWSPDGTTIAHFHGCGLGLVEPGGTDLRIPVEHSGTRCLVASAWSPDSRQIATTMSWEETPGTRTWAVLLTDRDGNNPVTIFQSDYQFIEHRIAWSPDGAWIGVETTSNFALLLPERCRTAGTACTDSDAVAVPAVPEDWFATFHPRWLTSAEDILGGALTATP